jgi:sugar phosphate isomerase/epimerase
MSIKLAVSNIAWSFADDATMFQFLESMGYEGLEIAPTRIIKTGNAPYEALDEARTFSEYIKKFSLKIPSMQSIWFGRTENMFAGEIDRKTLLDYTKKAVVFAETINCKNLVFGSPKNRNIENKASSYADIALDFFNEIGDEAKKHGTTIALEANPSYYGTNFINTTGEAFDFCNRLQNKGVMVNVDLGTVFSNGESLESIFEYYNLINHVHISEPNLDVIKKREEHKLLFNLLNAYNYDKYVSIEMKNPNNINITKNAIEYVKELFS